MSDSDSLSLLRFRGMPAPGDIPCSVCSGQGLVLLQRWPPADGTLATRYQPSSPPATTAWAARWPVAAARAVECCLGATSPVSTTPAAAGHPPSCVQSQPDNDIHQCQVLIWPVVPDQVAESRSGQDIELVVSVPGIYFREGRSRRQQLLLRAPTSRNLSPDSTTNRDWWQPLIAELPLTSQWACPISVPVCSS